MQQYAVYILLQNHSTCFGCRAHHIFTPLSHNMSVQYQVLLLSYVSHHKLPSWLTYLF